MLESVRELLRHHANNNSGSFQAVSDATVLTGADLDERAKLCSLQPDGRLALPPVASTDIRITGSKRLKNQVCVCVCMCVCVCVCVCLCVCGVNECAYLCV